MRAAVYARFSSQNQREQSIEDQVRVCRTFAARDHRQDQACRSSQEGWSSRNAQTSGSSRTRTGPPRSAGATRAEGAEINSRRKRKRPPPAGVASEQSGGAGTGTRCSTHATNSNLRANDSSGIYPTPDERPNSEELRGIRKVTVRPPRRSVEAPGWPRTRPPP
jgi:hypothetical protein